MSRKKRIKEYIYFYISAIDRCIFEEEKGFEKIFLLSIDEEAWNN